MKYFGLAIMLVCLNFMVGIVNTMDIGLISAGSNTLDGKIGDDDLVNVINANSTATFTNAGWDPINYVTSGVNVLFRFLYQITFGLPDMLRSTPFNMPGVWIDFFMVLQIIIYAVGMAEFFRGIAVEY
jgi:hypothetical protein